MRSPKWEKSLTVNVTFSQSFSDQPRHRRRCPEHDALVRQDSGDKRARVLAEPFSFLSHRSVVEWDNSHEAMCACFALSLVSSL